MKTLLTFADRFSPGKVTCLEPRKMGAERSANTQWRRANQLFLEAVKVTNRDEVAHLLGLVEDRHAYVRRLGREHFRY